MVKRMILPLALFVLFTVITLPGGWNTALEVNAAAKKAVKQYPFPGSFVYVDEVIPGARFDIRYYGENNFVGRRIAGYHAPYAILTKQAATALKAVSDELKPKGYAIKIYDAYRPQKAVNDFIQWSKDAADIKMKRQYYPRLEKKNLFKLGFIASKSGHSRGSTVDLTLVSLKTGKLVDMGGPHDFFGSLSYYQSPQITAAQQANRRLLKEVMNKHGFKGYSKEWWHFTLVNEPFPGRYFDFDVE
ncbi:M15 family metallopeptidase [Paenibacillus sabinae]|uniref:D-alanyl-D-alanine dipeptidase n=1 Tax=Paenibacillus sabinae T27 TaxID=1268072 RepID=X5A130_9BACL|nr:M15 family metallopeptidase [Paenibacillus sabinae]AHV97569.1 D-alanyl-D-alanine dipeptidase [Paenibacillus sabinae T27]